MTGMTAISRFAEFVSSADVPAAARAAARDAVQDTVGVALAGAGEPAAGIVQRVARADAGPGACSVLGTGLTAGPTWAALANGTAAHALDFDDMCWVSLAHPSAPLVAAGLAAGEAAGASGRVLLDAYVVGFEVECALGVVMNPAHYEQGWHCTSTIGAIGAAGAAARVLGLDAETTGRALSIAASEACGLKENFGTMVKPLQGGLAARNGVLAALLAREAFTASAHAIDGPQGFLVAMGSAGRDAEKAIDPLGRRWEIVEGGITVKLYPSCAATHPDHRYAHRPAAGARHRPGRGRSRGDRRRSGDPDGADPRPAGDRTRGQVQPALLRRRRAGVGAGRHRHLRARTRMRAPAVARLVPLVTMRADDRLGRESPPLTEARVTVRLAGGRTLERFVRGARGYPARPASRDELDGKFTTCARRAVSAEAAAAALDFLRALDTAASVGDLAGRLAVEAAEPQPV